MKSYESLIAALIASIVGAVLAPSMSVVLLIPCAVAIALAVVTLLGHAIRGRRSDPSPLPLATVSHEIRTPLNGILGLTQVLLRMEPTTRQREYLETIRASGESLLRLSNEILDYSKMRSGTLRFDDEVFHLRKWIRQTVRNLAPHAHVKRLELGVWVPPDVPDVLVGDPNRLCQVLSNLLINAIKFTREGDVLLEVDVQEQRDASVLLGFSVTDTGVGIPESQREHIFTAFAQGERGGASEGVGLGLAISSELVERMGGEIGCDSREGEGSTFRFTARFDVRDATTERPVHRYEDLRVLVIDDSELQRTILEREIRQLGLDVVSVSGWHEAEAALDVEEPFDLFLLDSDLAGEDPWQTARRLRASHRLPGALMSLSHEYIDPSKLKSHGLLGQLTKPIAPTHLLRAIEILSRGDARHDGLDAVQTQNMNRLFLAGLKILVADDSAVNRTVLTTMLVDAACRVEAVPGGQAALALVSRQQFDVVILDIEMPELSGLEIAERIRESERGTGRHLPLIAATAHASTEDREACHRAGMDGFLSKPFEEDRLVSVIRSCVSVTREPPEISFDRGQALSRASGDPILLAELAGLFLDESPGTFEAIRSALAVSDGRCVERLAHRLKGSLLTLAAPRAARMAAELETLARERQLSACASVLTELDEELRRLVPELEAVSVEVETP